jgi:phosphoribosyl 1,2-cyclic phosphate phosphodiesterase
LTIRFLGTGTSQGVPVIACNCDVCKSTDKRDHRLRSSILISTQLTDVVIDVGPDFRQQMLRAEQQKLDAVVLTHEHNDHVIGMDDLRPFNFIQKSNMPIYGAQHVLLEIQDRFKYAFVENPYPGAPKFELHAIDKNATFDIGDLQFQSVEVLHGKLPILGYRVKNFAYLTDVKTIPEDQLKKLEDLDCLVISALYRRPHRSHLNLEDAVKLVKQINPKQAFFTHISHGMGTMKQVKPLLPDNIQLAYDGLVLEVLE